MKSRYTLLAVAAALVAVPAVAQDIPAGPDAWDSLGAGATTVTLTSSDWAVLCGASSGNATASLKGFNLPGQGTADTVVNRLNNADLTTNSSADVDIQLAALSMVSDGTHPCSPATLRVTSSDQDTQRIGTMTITRTSSLGGTFLAKVPIDADIVAVDSAGNPVGGTVHVAGDMDDVSASPWSYAAGVAWKPAVDPVTKQKVRVCRRGNKILPAIHCYWPPPKCKAIIRPVAVDFGNAVIEPVEGHLEPCFVDAVPIGN